MWTLTCDCLAGHKLNIVFSGAFCLEALINSRKCVATLNLESFHLSKMQVDTNLLRKLPNLHLKTIYKFKRLKLVLSSLFISLSTRFRKPSNFF